MRTNSFLPNRRDILATATAAGAFGLLVEQMPQALAGPTTPEGPGSASGAPHLPKGFTDTFSSRFVNANGLRLHAVIGGKGRPLLLVHGWPQTWYQWRLLMPALARDFQVIAVDQRGIGLSDKPQSGYDTGTQAKDMVGLMDALGHKRFAMVGGSFGSYRAIDADLAQNEQRKTRRLVLPVLAVGGEKGIGEGTAKTMKLVADNVQAAVIPGSGHWVAEEAPEKLLEVLIPFLAPYRDGSGAAPSEARGSTRGKQPAR